MSNDRIKRLLLDEAAKRGFNINWKDDDYIHSDCQIYLDGGFEPDEPVTLAEDDRRLLLALQAFL